MWILEGYYNLRLLYQTWCKNQDVRPVWKMIDKYFELPVCMLEEMKFWEQTKSLSYT